MKFHFRTQLIESFLTTSGLRSCAEESCTSHQFTPYTNWSVTKGCFHHFGGLWCFEQVTVRKPHAGFGGRQNLESVQLTVEEKYYFTPVDLFKPVHVRSLHNVKFCPFEGPFFSFLRPILLKLNIWTHPIESFPTAYGLWSCIEIKMSSPLGAHA